MHVPGEEVVCLYHRQGYPVVSDKHNDASVIYEQVNVCAHPVPVVLQPAK